jgi:hypothetical protein
MDCGLKHRSVGGAWGQKRTCRSEITMSALPPKADMAPCNYEYAPEFVRTVSSSRFDPERPCGLRAACCLTTSAVASVDSIGGAPTRIGRLGVPIALEKEAEAVVARNGNIDRRPAHQEAALGLVVEHRDELGAVVGLAAQRLVRDDDRGSRQCGRCDAIEHILRDGDAVGGNQSLSPTLRRSSGGA